MTPLFLLEALREVIYEKIKGMTIEERPVQVRTGFLPPKINKPDSDPDEENTVPFVLVRLLEGEDTFDHAGVTVAIYVCTWSESEKGWRDAVNVMMAIRLLLEQYPTLDERYRLEYPFKWKMFEDQPWPEWFGAITTKWEFAKPQSLEGLEGGW